MIETGPVPGPRHGGRLICRMLLGAALLTSLQGCVEMMVGTAVVGTMAATDRRMLGAQTEDTAITVKAEARMPSLIGDSGHVNIASFNRKVLLPLNPIAPLFYPRPK